MFEKYNKQIVPIKDLFRADLMSLDHLQGIEKTKQINVLFNAQQLKTSR